MVKSAYLLMALAAIGLSAVFFSGGIDVGLLKTEIVLALTVFLVSLVVNELRVRVSRKSTRLPPLPVEHIDFRPVKRPNIIQWGVTLFVAAYGGAFAFLAFTLLYLVFVETFVNGGTLLDQSIFTTLTVGVTVAVIAGVLIRSSVLTLRTYVRQRKRH